MVNGQRFRLVTATHGPTHLVEVDGVAHRISLDEGGVVRSPAPALVVATPISVGDQVEAGAPILVLESMKMETVLRAPFRARVRECPVSVGSQVETGAPLMRLEPLSDGADAAQAEPAVAEIDLPPALSGESAQLRSERALSDLRSLLLGFDVTPGEGVAVLKEYLAARAELTDRPMPGEVDLLTVFADLSEPLEGRNIADWPSECSRPRAPPRQACNSVAKWWGVRTFLTDVRERRSGIDAHVPTWSR